MTRRAENLTRVESIRKRPAMYLGGTDFFGLILYLVCAVAMLIGRRPTRISVIVDNGEFLVESDIAVPIDTSPGGELYPFEDFPEIGEEHDDEHGYEGTILNALAERLNVEIQREDRLETLSFHRGLLESRNVLTTDLKPNRTTLRFVPDASIFTLLELSPTIFKSYLRRLSYLHRGLQFSLRLGDEFHEYHAERGIADLFDQVAAPYQTLHEPIHFTGEDGSLKLEAIFAYHSWKEKGLWCFVNNGRAVEGGTHERGLHDALDQIDQKYRPENLHERFRNGVVGILSIQYPEAVGFGCLKAMISNPELYGMVRDLVVKGTADWLQARPDVKRELQQIQTFAFPDVFYR